MAYARRSNQEIEDALREHRTINNVCHELQISRETVRKRILKSKRLQVVKDEVTQQRGDVCEDILDANMKLAAFKGKRVLELLALIESDKEALKELWRWQVDKEGCELALKQLKTDKHKDRGYTEKQEIDTNVTIPKVVMEIVRTNENSGTEDTDNGQT